MAKTHDWFGPGLENIFNRSIDLVNDTIKVALMKEAYSPAEGDENWDATHECDDADYTPGGITLPISGAEINYVAGTVIITTSASNGETIFTEQGDISSYYAVVYSETADKLLSWVDFDGVEMSENGVFKIVWQDSEILRVDVN